MIFVRLAIASGPVFTPVITDLGGGAVVDWSAAKIEVTASSSRRGAEGTRAVEELARRKVDDRIQVAALSVAVDPDRTLGDFRALPELWPSIEPRIRRWTESENRYFSSGRVVVVGAISLVDLLKPYSMASATARPSRPPTNGATGAIIDARGLDAVPCFAPVLKGPGGVLYDSRMWLDVVVREAPALWVNDGAHPAGGRAGANPVLARAEDAAGCVLTVGAAAEDALQGLVESGVLASGTLVVVVGAP